MDELYGAEGGAVLRRCLADMRASGCLGDVPLLRLCPVPVSLGGELGNEVAVTLGAGLSIVLKANHQRPPKLKGGAIDWMSVHRLLIQRIEHENG